jgi:UDP-N-acetylmuramate dehydrogenase
MSIIHENFPLLNYNTFHLDVNARYLVELKDTEEITHFLKDSGAAKRPFFILGGGSNVLFTGDYPGLIIRPVIMGIEKIGEENNHVLVRAGAGEDWDLFVNWCVNEDLGGIENLSLIPGSVGASPVQNIGAYGVEVGEVLHSVEAVNMDNGRQIVMNANKCRFSYRNSIFKNELRGRVIITHAIFRLSRDHQFKTNYGDLKRELDNFPVTNIRNIRDAVISIRNSKLPDPKDIGNAGSFFKNPIVTEDQSRTIRNYHPEMPVFPAEKGTVKLSAAWLIDQCGFKGKRSGKTGTYKKQPLILVNYGGATGKEIFNFALKIQKSVQQHFGILLEPEVNLVGDIMIP